MDVPYLNIHIAAKALHYGQGAFEGFKAFRGGDGQVRIFRPDKNAERMRSAARRTFMVEVPTELFVNAIKKVVMANEEFFFLRHWRLLVYTTFADWSGPENWRITLCRV